MGLTIQYDWKLKCDVARARLIIERLHGIAKQLPFDHVTPIFEQDPPAGKTKFEHYVPDVWREGGLYLSRRRADGLMEILSVPATHAIFFVVRVEGAETASIGLASHPPVALHREDIVDYDDDGKEIGRQIEAGDPIEFPTRRRGYYSWHSFCKTQYASNPTLGGEPNFLKAHLTLIELLDQVRQTGATVNVRDDSKYAKHRNVDRLLKTLRDWNGLIAHFAGSLGDALNKRGLSMVAPIKDHPDFEHMEARGIEVLRKLAARQRRRGKRG